MTPVRAIRARRMSWLRWATEYEIANATIDGIRPFLESRGWEKVQTEPLCQHRAPGERWRKILPNGLKQSVWIPNKLCPQCTWPLSQLRTAQRAIATIEKLFILAALEGMLPHSGPWNRGSGMLRSTGG